MDCPDLPAEWLDHPGVGLRQAVAELPADCVRQRLAELGVDSALWLADIPAGPPLPFKDERDAYGVPESVASDDVVVRWGGGLDEADALALLADVDAAWAAEIGQLGYPAPPGLESWKLNVYVGDTGGNTPGDLGAAGYYTVDADGHPMLVVSVDTAQDVDGRRHITTAHELFHAIQDGTGAYAFGTGEAGAWWWEASAVWVNLEVHPQDAGAVDYLLGWTFFPHLSVDHFEYPDGVSLVGYHAYGAYVFAEQVGAEAVRASWVEPTSDDPLASLDAHVDVDAELSTLWGRVAGWSEPAWQEAHERDAARFPDDDHRLAATLQSGWNEVPEDTWPADRGVNHLSFSPDEGTARTDIALRGQPGTEGTDADWTVLAVRGDEVLVDPVSVPGDAPFLLVVAPLAHERVEAEVFGYEVQVRPRARDCGCATGSPAGGLVGALLAWLGLRTTGRSGTRSAGRRGPSGAS